MNTFFSGSFKTYTSFPTNYPANSAVFVNGTVIDPYFKNITFNFLDLEYGDKGYIESGEY